MTSAAVVIMDALNVVHAAPKDTSVRWYDAPHQLNETAYRDAFTWLMAKLAR